MGSSANQPTQAAGNAQQAATPLNQLGGGLLPNAQQLASTGGMGAVQSSALPKSNAIPYAAQQANLSDVNVFRMSGQGGQQQGGFQPSAAQMQQMQGFQSALDTKQNEYFQQFGKPTDQASADKFAAYMKGLPEYAQAQQFNQGLSAEARQFNENLASQAQTMRPPEMGTGFEGQGVQPNQGGSAAQARQLLLSGDAAGAMSMLKSNVGMQDTSLKSADALQYMNATGDQAGTEQILRSSVGLPTAQPAVMPPEMGTGFEGQGVQPTTGQPNVFQQSQGAFGQAQKTLTDLSNFQPQQMQAAQAGPTATFGGAQLGPAAQFGGAQLGRTATYGGATVAPTQTYGGATVQQTQGPQAAKLGPASQMTTARVGPAAQMQGVGAVQSAQAPGQIAVDQLRTMDISQYMNPYTQQVVEAGQRDIERQRQLASEKLGAQATAAKAFGGSRQAVQEGVLAGEALRQAGQLSAQQRQAGFQQAQQAGQFDIGQTQAARTLASQQGFQAEQLGQQAREAAAAREQAARAGNMQAANQFALQQSQLEQQARSANQAAQNQFALAQAGYQQAAGLQGSTQEAARAAQQAGLTQQAGLAGAAAQNAAAAQQAGLTQAANLASMGALNQAAITQAGFGQQAGLANQAAQNQFSLAQAGYGQQAGLSNQAAINAAIQAAAGRQQAANAANFQGQFQGAGVRQGAAGGLAGLGGQLFGVGQQIQGAIGQQGAFQRGLQQQLLDRAMGQYGGATGAPMSGLGALSSILSGVPYGQTTTSSTPFNPLGLIGAFI